MKASTNTGLIQEDNDHNIHALQLYLEKDIWNSIPAELGNEFLNIRQRIENYKGQSHNKTNNETKTVGAKMSTTTPKDASVDLFLQNEDNDSDDEVDIYGRSVGTMKVQNVTLNRERYHKVMNFKTLENYHYSVIDSGCDTCLIGKGWTILSTHRTRKANVVGYDDDTMKKGLSIVTGITAVDFEGGKIILLKVNEAVLNSTSEHTLLLDFQL